MRCRAVTTGECYNPRQLSRTWHLESIMDIVNRTAYEDHSHEDGRILQ